MNMNKNEKSCWVVLSDETCIISRPVTSEVWGLTVENPKDVLCVNEPEEVKRLLAQELARNPISTVSKKATLWTRGTMHGLGDICLAEIFK